MVIFKKPAKVLIVDDESTLAYLFAEYLGRSFQARWFTAPAQALEYLGGHEADILVSDLVMPDMDGFEFVAKAKQLCSSLRLVLVTGTDPWAWPPSGEKSFDLVDAYLAKPVPLRTLESCCHRLLRGKPRPPFASQFSYLEPQPPALSL